MSPAGTNSPGRGQNSPRGCSAGCAAVRPSARWYHMLGAASRGEQEPAPQSPAASRCRWWHPGPSASHGVCDPAAGPKGEDVSPGEGAWLVCRCMILLVRQSLLVNPRAGLGGQVFFTTLYILLSFLCCVNFEDPVVATNSSTYPAELSKEFLSCPFCLCCSALIPKSKSVC